LIGSESKKFWILVGELREEKSRRSEEISNVLKDFMHTYYQQMYSQVRLPRTFWIFWFAGDSTARTTEESCVSERKSPVVTV